MELRQLEKDHVGEMLVRSPYAKLRQETGRKMMDSQSRSGPILGQLKGTASARLAMAELVAYSVLERMDEAQLDVASQGKT